MSTSDDVKKLREAFIAASVWCGGPMMRTNAEVEAARRYPLPLRVVRLTVSEYRFNAGVLEYCDVNGVWRKSTKYPNVAHIAALYDLMQRPYEGDAEQNVGIVCPPGCPVCGAEKHSV